MKLQASLGAGVAPWACGESQATGAGCGRESLARTGGPGTGVWWGGHIVARDGCEGGLHGVRSRGVGKLTVARGDEPPWGASTRWGWSVPRACGDEPYYAEEVDRVAYLMVG